MQRVKQCRDMLVIGLVLLILLGCIELKETVCKPAPCGCEGATKQYANQQWECTQQNWQVVVW
jgi:hypothetical protein